MNRFWKLDKQIDSFDFISSDKLVCSTSNLEGNNWNGSIHMIDLHHDSSNPSINFELNSGCSKIKSMNSNHDLILTARDDGSIGIHSKFDLSSIKIIDSHDDIVSSLALDENDNSIFYSSGWDGFIKYYNIGDEISIICETKAHQGIINDIKHSNRLNLLATTGQDGFARIWDGKNISKGCMHIINTEQISTSLIWDEYSDNELIIGQEDGCIKNYDIRTNKVISSFSLPTRINKLCIQYDNNQFLWVGTEGGQIYSILKDTNQSETNLLDFQRLNIDFLKLHILNFNQHLFYS